MPAPDARARGLKRATMPNRLAAVISDTLYLYPAELAPTVDAAIERLRDDRRSGSLRRFVAAIQASGVTEASEDEIDAFTFPDHEGDALHLPFPG